MSRVPYPFTAVRTDDDDSGKNIVPYASVNAKDAAGAPANIYTAQAGGTPSSSFILDANGQKQIWVEPGIYQFSVAGGAYFSVFASSYTTEEFTLAEKNKLSIAEITSNKKTNLLSPNNTGYPTTLAVSEAISSVSSGEFPQGAWNASTNTPALVSGVGTAGHSYEVSVAGSTNLNGETGWQVGDKAIFNGSIWTRIPANAVRSVNGRTGNIVNQFDSAAYMVASTDIQIGDVVETISYPAGWAATANGPIGGNAYEIVAAGTGTADGGAFIDLVGISGQAKGLFPNGLVNIDQFGARKGDVGTYASANYTAIQNAINYVRGVKSGGTVKVPPGVYQIDQTITVWERVRLEGENGTARNFWYNGTYTADGSVIKLATGSDTDVIKVALSTHAMVNPFPVETNTDRRTMAAVCHLAIDGNRSKTYAHTNKDLNATGNGLILEGINIVEVHDIVITRCADDGMVTKSAAVPDSQCNNMYIHRIYSCANGGKGFSLSGGDSQIGFLWAGGNGANGITSSMGNSVLTNITANDNLGHGIYHAANDSSLVNLLCYDNHLNGCVVAQKNTRAGGVFRHNGRDTGAAATDRCGLVVTSAATNSIVLGGSTFYDDGYLGDPMDITQQYGLRVLNAAVTISVGETHAFGNVVSDYSIANSANIVMHEGIGSLGTHPGFVSRGNIDFNGFAAQQISGLSRSTPQTISSVASNILALSATSLVTLNVSGGATINSITDTFNGLGDVCIRNINASSVTFTEGSNIRTKAGVNLVLAQNKVVHLIEFASGVWFEV